MRLIVLIGLLCGLTACSTLPIAKKMTPQTGQHKSAEAQLQAAIKQISTTGKTELLQQVAEQKAGTTWGQYAELVVKMAAELEQEKQRQQQQSQEGADCGSFNTEKEALQQENIELNQKIEQLKKLLIELEQRSQ